MMWLGAFRLTTVSIDHSHSQQPVPRGFLLFKRCEWLIHGGLTTLAGIHSGFLF